MYDSNIKAFEAILQCGTKIYTEIRVLMSVCVTLSNLVSIVLLLKYNLFRSLAKHGTLIVYKDF